MNDRLETPLVIITASVLLLLSTATATNDA